MNGQYNNRYSCPVFNKELKQELREDLPSKAGVECASTVSVSGFSTPEQSRTAASTSEQPSFPTNLPYPPDTRPPNLLLVKPHKRKERSLVLNRAHQNQSKKENTFSLRREGMYSSSDSEMESQPVQSPISPSPCVNPKRNKILRNRPRPIPLTITTTTRSFSDAPKSGTFAKRWRKDVQSPPGTPTKRNFAVRYVQWEHRQLCMIINQSS
ncbi:hypothetical protein K493DRAFT_45757 [Basidiobolus meristosporus CBS 931.73]|uniref:Uncharacterized protein n=1 Tax=Basidiobolus meristosporus CBS 931.73 TaxID=1314790 RepID=A0A1Y1Y2N7_9FUNG|nr:hypothetical protein K493DRAFT_45757 [Basidiobolus meristosporus CBS 931.73]|eukprot:ORX92145.1 hypothetical protein K493DRAFT_45757 [Basidiobolus meristosporus CBS 931.73]